MKDNNPNISEEKKELNNATNDAIVKTFITDSDNINSKNEVNQ